MKNCIVLLRKLFAWILLAVSPLAGVNAAVWENRHQWDDDWEKKYVSWVSEKWTKNFFMDEKRPEYYKIAHDCADSTYFMRLVFAYENQLPFVIRNPSRPGRLLTNQTSRFDHHPAGKRLRAFLDFIADKVSTRSLPDDTYPIALNTLRPGDIFVAPGSHSYQIVKLNETGVPLLMSSTTPKAVHFMFTLEGFPLYLPTEMEKMTDGFRRFRQPQDIHKPAEKLPDFSTEQYQLAEDADYNYVEFSNKLVDMLLKRPETLEEKAGRLLKGLCALAKNRVEYVNDGVKYIHSLRKNKRRKCMTRDEYLQYSSYSRDSRLTVYFNQSRKFMYQLYETGEDTAALTMMRIIFTPGKPSPLNKGRLKQQCQIFYSPASQQALDLHDIWFAISGARLESNPHATLEQRWGLADIPYVRKCPHYE